MNKDTKDIIEQVIGLIAFTLILAFIYFAVCCNQAKADVPKRWICWVNSVKDSSCGTYGWSGDKKVAADVTMKKCEKHCEDSCKLDYCELEK